MSHRPCVGHPLLRLIVRGVASHCFVRVASLHAILFMPIVGAALSFRRVASSSPIVGATSPIAGAVLRRVACRRFRSSLSCTACIGVLHQAPVLTGDSSHVVVVGTVTARPFHVVGLRLQVAS